YGCLGTPRAARSGSPPGFCQKLLFGRIVRETSQLEQFTRTCRPRWPQKLECYGPISTEVLVRSSAAHPRACSLSASVLRVANVLHPVDDLAVERFLNCDMRHGRRRRCAMPMLFARRKPDYVSRSDFLDRTAPVLRPTDAGGDDQSLAERMRMP